MHTETETCLWNDSVNSIFSGKPGKSLGKMKTGKCNLNPLSANPTKWPKTLKQFVGKLPTNCLSMFGHFVKLALKGLRELPKSK